MGIFVQDTFTGTAGTLLTAHTSEVGGWTSTGPWGAYPPNDSVNAKLTGAGAATASACASREATITNTSVAPQLDVYVETTVNVGTRSGSRPGLTIDPHDYVRGGGSVYTGGVEILFDSTGTWIYAPWFYDTGPYETDLPAVPDNGSATFRTEYDFSGNEIRMYWNGDLVATWTIYAPSAPAQPGVLVFQLDSYGATGNGLTIDYVELGTLTAPPPPTAFWTDLTGSLVETIGA